MTTHLSIPDRMLNNHGMYLIFCQWHFIIPCSTYIENFTQNQGKHHGENTISYSRNRSNHHVRPFWDIQFSWSSMLVLAQHLLQLFFLSSLNQPKGKKISFKITKAQKFELRHWQPYTPWQERGDSGFFQRQLPQLLEGYWIKKVSWE